MNNQFTKFALRWIVFFSICTLSAVVPDAVNSAFAETGNPIGAISGGFFTDNAILAGMPALAAPLPIGAIPAAGTGMCEKAIATASAGHQLPPGMLHAIAVVESGRLDPKTGMNKPWPWTIDANGTGYVYDSAQSAITAARAFEVAGITSLDIGCLQVNLAQHPDAFQTLAEAFDPDANADYAASFLTSLNQKFGNWPQAVAAYHSQTAALGAPYAAKVYAAWQAAPGVPAFASIPGNSAAPVAAQPAFAMTALAPSTTILARPGRPLNGRGLASYRATPVLLARLPPQG